MPSRVHWVFMTGNTPRFDRDARAFVFDGVRRRAATQLPAAMYRDFVHRMEDLPNNFRQALPRLMEMGAAVGWSELRRLRKFRLPKRLRANKNPIRLRGTNAVLR